jgi:hypothetical protein
VSSNYTALAFDIDDVLFSWLPDTRDIILPRTLKDMMSLLTWFEYERARISQEVCYERVGQGLSLTPKQIVGALDHVKDSRQSDEALVSNGEL